MLLAGERLVVWLHGKVGLSINGGKRELAFWSYATVSLKEWVFLTLSRSRFPFSYISRPAIRSSILTSLSRPNSDESNRVFSRPFLELSFHPSAHSFSDISFNAAHA